MMINVNCRTNLDNCNHGWPDELPAVPNVGDLIESSMELVGGRVLQLEVKQVTWKYYKRDKSWEPQIELGLVTGRFRSMRDFQVWIEWATGRIDEDGYKYRIAEIDKIFSKQV